MKELLCFYVGCALNYLIPLHLLVFKGTAQILQNLEETLRKKLIWVGVHHLVSLTSCVWGFWIPYFRADQQRA